MPDSAEKTERINITLYRSDLEALKARFPDVPTSRLIRMGWKLLIEAHEAGKQLPMVR